MGKVSLKESTNGAQASGSKAPVEVVIKAPNIQTAEFRIKGTAPLVIHKFSTKAREQIMATQAKGDQAKTRKKREAKDFEAVYNEARHLSREGWDGVPANAFRAAMVSACRTAGFVMSRAKLAFFIEADGYDKDEGTPLIKIEGKPRKHEGYARNDNGSVDIRVRPMWEQWGARVRIRFDADMLSVTDISNLLMRAGLQVGICEGRPDSKNSTGCGWGTFEVEGKK
jgi:hypothetical protein